MPWAAGRSTPQHDQDLVIGALLIAGDERYHFGVRKVEIFLSRDARGHASRRCGGWLVVGFASLVSKQREMLLENRFGRHCASLFNMGGPSFDGGTAAANDQATEIFVVAA